MKPLVSIVIVSYNKPEYLDRALESVYGNMEGLRAEVIVVDDASDKKTTGKLQDLKKVYGFQLELNSNNQGPSACRNIGIDMSQGEYIAFLDSDDYWLSDRLRVTLSPLINNRRLDFTFCDAYFEVENILTDERQSALMAPPRSGNLLEHLFRRNCINMCAVAMKTSLAQRTKFDETLRSAEDYDFWLRVAATSNRYLYIDKPLVVYRLHRNNLSFKRLLSIDSALRVLDKNTKLATAAIAKENLRLHRQSLLQDRLKLKDADPSETLSLLQEVRDLGERETLVKTASSVHARIGKIVRDRLIK